MSTLKSASLLALALAAAACGTKPDTSATAGAHYDANHCEIFFDKAFSLHDSHGYNELDMFLKVLPERLDGAIAKVGLWAKVSDTISVCSQHPDQYRCDGLDVWKDIPAQAFFSNDYYRVDLYLSGDYMPTLQYESVPYVRTDKGTTYWAKAAGGANFTINRAMGDTVQIADGTYAYRSDDTIDHLPKTADKIPSLNPGLCR